MAPPLTSLAAGTVPEIGPAETVAAAAAAGFAAVLLELFTLLRRGF